MSLYPVPGTPGPPIEVCIISQNHLVNLYLCKRLCDDPLIRCVPFQDLMEGAPGAGESIIFIFDASDMTVPLSRCMQTLENRFPDGRYLFVLKRASLDQVSGFLELGIDGLMDYEDVENHLDSAVKEIARGNIWRSPSLHQSVRNASKQLARRNNGDRSALTCREFDIVQLARQKLTNKEIACLVGIEESTVKFHLSNIFSKLNVSTRDELMEPSRRDGALSRFLLAAPSVILPAGEEGKYPLRSASPRRRPATNYRGVAC